MKKILSMLLVAVMMFSVLSLTVAADTVTYSVAKDADGNPLSVRVINGQQWVEDGGKLKMPAGPENSFLLFDTKLNTNRIEVTIAVNDNLLADGNHRNGVVFAFDNIDDDAEIGHYATGDDYSAYWAFIDDWACLHVFEIGKNAKDDWSNLDVASESGAPAYVDIPSLEGADLTDGITLTAEWDNNGGVKVWAEGVLCYDFVDPTPISGDYYGSLVNKWANTPEGTAAGFIYDAPITSFIAGVKSENEHGDTTVIVSLIALVAAMGTGIVIGKKRSFN